MTRPTLPRLPARVRRPRPHRGVSPARGRARAWLALLAALALTLTLPAAPAHAAEVSVAVTLTDLRLDGNRPKDRVTLTGTLVNDGAQAAFGVHVVLWRSRDPIRDPNVLRQVASGENVPWGDRLIAKPTHYAKITESTVSLDPGKSADFAVSATLQELGFTAQGAAYVFGVQVLGTPDASSNYSTIGRARTFLTVGPTTPVPLTTAVLLSSAPSQFKENVFVDDHLAGELTGRLDELLRIAERPGVSHLIDPSLYEDVVDMADGYEVQSGDALIPGTGQAAAAAWLERFVALPTAFEARTLYANPDVLGASQAGDRDVLNRALAATAAVEPLGAMPLVVLPYRGRADAALIDYLKAAGADAILATTAGTGPALAAGPGATPIVRVATATASGPGDETGPVQQRQRLLADAVLAKGQVRLITEPEQDGQFGPTPRWLRPRPLTELLTSSPGPAATLTLPAKVSTFSPPVFARLHRLATDFTAYGQLVPDSVLTARAPGSLTRAASWLWFGPADQAAYHQRLEAAVGAASVAEKVHLDATPRFLMSARSNLFPLTVTNDLDEPVRVKVIVTSSNPLRLTIPPSGVVTIDPGQSQTVNVRPEASANGVVAVNARVATADGQPVGPATAITVDVTDLGLIGWIIVIVSGLVLVGATAWRIRQVRRSQAKEQP